MLSLFVTIEKNILSLFVYFEIKMLSYVILTNDWSILESKVEFLIPTRLKWRYSYSLVWQWIWYLIDKEKLSFCLLIVVKYLQLHSVCDSFLLQPKVLKHEKDKSLI